MDPTSPRVHGQPREGRRISALADAYNSSIRHALRGLDEEQFTECFPDTRMELLEILWEGYRQVLHASRVHIESEFDTICEETLLTDKLHQLEELCEAQGIADGDADAKPAEGGCAGPTQAVRAALLAARRAEIAQLEAILATAAARRAELEASLDKRVQELESAARSMRALAVHDTNVARAALSWENQKVARCAAPVTGAE